VLGLTTISIPTWGSASVIDVIWTAIGLCGFTFVAWGLHGSIENMQLLAERHFEDPEERMAAVQITRNYVIHDLLRLLSMNLIIILGVIALMQDGPKQITITAFAVTTLLFLVMIIVAFHSYLDQRQRRKLRVIFDKELR
jgi:ABC-type multidrug transport system fused ATPase/permease subunit